MTGTPHAAFAGPMHGTVAGVAFALLLTAVCVSDLRTRRIPNSLVLLIAVGGGLYSVAAHAPLDGLIRASAAVAVGLALWLPLYFFRMMGAGDVKFFAAACAWLDPATAVRAAFLTALFGGGLALLWIVRGAARGRAARVSSPDQAPDAAPSPGGAARRKKLPYGLAMAAGLAAAVWFNGSPY